MLNSAINIIGPYTGVSGYDHHVRSFVDTILKSGFKVCLTDLPGWTDTKLAESLLPDWHNKLQNPVASDIYLHFCMPHQLQFRTPGRNILFTMFEADRIPAAWIEPSRLADHIIVPAASCAQAWILSGVSPEKISICPLGIDAGLFKKDNNPLVILDKSGHLIHNYKFRFINISEIRPRKNLINLLRVWMQTTSSSDDAILILKITGLQNGYSKDFDKDMEEMRSSLNITEDKHAPIHFIREVMPYSSLIRLYQAGSHYISLSKGEGWDLPMMEAGAAGLTLVAPYHSAYLTYLTERTAHFIKSRKVPVTIDGNLGKEDLVFFKDACWWEPDLEDAAIILRGILDEQLPSPASPRNEFLNTYTWEKATGQLLNILETCLQTKSE